MLKQFQKKLRSEKTNPEYLLAQDEARTKKLHQHGFQVLRYWNKDILNDVSLVLNSILDALEKR